MDMPYQKKVTMNMPDEVLLEIFSWLPAKSICRFKCVNKFFNTTISSSSSKENYFIQKQTRNSLLKDDVSCFFLQPDLHPRYGAKTEFHHLCATNQSSGVSDKFLQFLEQYPNCRIVSSSNGLILGRNGNELFICNPVTQSWLPIPTPNFLVENPDADLKIALECTLEDPNNFMLILFEVQDNWASQYHDVKIYSTKEGIWKETETSFFVGGGRPLRFDMHVYHKKALHFISYCFPFYTKESPYFRPYIMAYNIEDGSSRMLRVPKGVKADRICDLRIYKWGKLSSSNESICLVRLRRMVFTIWVLTDYEANTWRETLKVRVKAMGIKEDPIAVTGFTVMNGERLIFAPEKKVYGYGLLRQETCMKLEEICEHGFGDPFYYLNFTTYSDTLRPCGDDAAKLPLLPQQHSQSSSLL